MLSVRICVFALLVPASVTTAIADDSVSPAVQQLAHHATTMIDAIVEHHIDPPTRQEMVLNCLRRAAAIRQQPLPSNLAAEISNAAPDDLNELLLQHLTALETNGTAVERRHDSKTVHWLPSSRLTEYIQPLPLRTTSAKEARIEKQLAANRYVGIGIRLGRSESDPMIQHAFAGGPAAAAGARANDIIREIDGTSTSGLQLGEVVERLRGAKGTTVEVVLQQSGEDNKRTYTMTRGVVPIPGISKVVYSTDERAAGIRIETVTASTVQELRKKESELAAGTQVVILDVRSLADHKLHYGKLLANALIDGRPVGMAETRTGQEQFDAEPGRLFAQQKLILLIGPETGGTLEWIAGAVQDQQQGLLLGAPTLGNGYAAETLPSRDADMLIDMPVARLRRVGGQPLYQAVFFDRLSPEVRMVIKANESVNKRDTSLPRRKPNHQGPGVRPDFGPIHWAQSPPGQRDVELAAAVERVLTVLPASELTVDLSAGES